MKRMGRMTTTTTVPRTVPQLMLEGQAAAPEGPVEIAPMYLMHRAFRRDLDAFADVIATVAVADRRRWALLARRFALFATVLHKHHSGEDRAMWPLLIDRGADPAALGALAAQHADIDPLVTSVANDLRGLAAGIGDAATRDR